MIMLYYIACKRENHRKSYLKGILQKNFILCSKKLAKI